MIPNPGTQEAIDEGCICPTMDNEYGRGYMGIEGIFVHRLDCPVHTLEFESEKKMNLSENARLKDSIGKLKAELETYRERHRDAKSNFATIQRLREENSLREAENLALFVTLDTYDEEIERLKRRAESIECAECGKNNYLCDCEDMVALDEQND